MSDVPDLDRALGFIIPGRDARGRIVRIGPVLEEILGAHGYPPVIEQLLTEALAVTALLGAMLKDHDGQLTMQAQTQGGPIALMVCDYQGGQLRGYVEHDAERIAALPKSPDLTQLFGEGYLAITFDQAATKERYQGIVPLEGPTIASAVEGYFYQSEQIPSLVRVAIEGDVAGAMLLQHLPDGEDGRDRIHTRLDHPEWEHVAVMGGSVSNSELTDPALPFETILWRLFNEEDEVRTLTGIPLSKGCRCDPAHIRKVLAQFPEDERRAMQGDDGIIRVDCAFCAKSFPVPSAD
jgi:molecular chaperone Hsp33